MFLNDTYRFSEGDQGTVQLRLSTGVFQDVTVTINGGMDEFSNSMIKKVLQCFTLLSSWKPS